MYSLETALIKDVGKHGWLIQHIHNPSEAVRLVAVKQDGWAIKDIENPTEKVKAVHLALCVI